MSYDDGSIFGFPSGREFPEYREGSTSIIGTRSGYLVKHGLDGTRPPWQYATLSLEAAITKFKLWRSRPCTSCGLAGCPEDIVGKKPFVVEPLPE